MSKLNYQLAADLILLVHALFVLFVVVGLAMVLLGANRGWIWVRNPIFRWAHLGAIVVVMSLTAMGIVCPLTSLEMYFRARGGDLVYVGSFIAHWLEFLLYYTAPSWVWLLAYGLFTAVVAWCWFAIPPSRAPQDKQS